LASYLVELIIDWLGDERFPYLDDPLASPQQKIWGKDHASRISQVKSRLSPLEIFLHYALRDAKITMQKPAVRKAYVTLARDPVPDLAITRHFVNFTRQYDPMQLLDIPHDAASYGEFAIECWEAALPKLEAETDFPTAFIRPQFDRFRKQGYAVGGTLKPQPIIGSKAKARIHGKVSGARTELWVEVTHRKDILFERKIWDTPDYAFNVAYYQRDTVVQDGHLIIRPAPLNLVPEARFPLDDLPEEFRKTLT
jgi:hypothetical protein